MTDQINITGTSHKVTITCISLEDAIATSERLLPGYMWIVRSDEIHGAFVNLLSPDTSICFPTWAPTPLEAFNTALTRAANADLTINADVIIPRI